MRKVTFNLFVFWLCQIAWLQVIAQENEVGIFIGNIPGKNGVQLKWFSKDMNLDAKYNLYRKEGAESNWIKVNTAVIQRTKTLTQDEFKKNIDLYRKDSAFVFYNSVMNKKETDEQLNTFLISGLVMQAIRNNELAAHLGIYFEDLTVQPGKTYSYRLTTAAKEKELALSNPIKVDLYKKESAPDNFQIKALDATVYARWDYSKTRPMYKVQRLISENVQLGKDFFNMPSMNAQSNKDTSNYFFVDNDSALQNGKSYFYRVSSFDFFGNESEFSLVLKATPKDQTAPYAIQGLKASVDGKKVKLTWKKSNESDCKGYAIYRSLTKDDGFKKISSTQLSKEETVFLDAAISESTDYFYYVEAEDRSGNVSKSMVIPFSSMDFTAPFAPSNLFARADTGKVFLSWNKNKEADIAGYYVYFAIKDEPSNYNLLNKKPIVANSFVDTLPKELSNYFIYKVAAADVNYNVSALSSPVFIRMPDVMPPASPVIKKIFIREKAIVITWIKPRLNNLKGFVLQRRSDLRAKYSSVNTNLISAKDTSFVDDDIEIGNTYSYQLIAVDSANNNSEASLPFTIVYMNSEVVKSPLNITLVYDDGKKEVRVNWTAINQPLNFKGYLVFRKEKGGNYLPLAEASEQNNFVDTTVDKNIKYFYRVNAMNIDGTMVKGSEEKEINCSAK